jgi:outer membrane protein TolC
MDHRFRLSIAYVLALLLVLVPLAGLCAEGPEVKEGNVRKLTVADAVLTALTNNVTLRSAYMDRYLQRIDLQMAERQYYLPTDPKLTLSTNRTSTYSSTSGSVQDLNGTGNMTASLAIPTGGTFTFAWNNTADRPDAGQRFAYSSDWSVTFTQPLLKGGGIENAAYSVRIARIAEEKNLLSLKDTIASTIKTAISAFRSYKSAERSLVIAEMALSRAKSLLDYNREMIAAGRLAGTEIVQAQADIASQEKSVIDAKNSLEEARLALLQAMYIDKQTPFQAVEESDQLIQPPSLQEALALAFQNRVDYLTALKGLEEYQLALDKAKRNRLWSLNLTAGTTDGAASTTFDTYDSALRRSLGSGAERNWNAGLSLEIPLVYMTSDVRSYLGAKNSLEKAKLSFDKLKADIEISVQSAIRNVDSNYRSLLSARQAKELAERKLNIEREKLGAGRTTNFQLVSFQKDVQTAQINESSALTSYLNSLTSLDDTLGTMLATWRITVKAEDDQFRPSGESAATSPKPGDLKNVQ